MFYITEHGGLPIFLHTRTCTRLHASVQLKTRLESKSTVQGTRRHNETALKSDDETYLGGPCANQILAVSHWSFLWHYHSILSSGTVCGAFRCPHPLVDIDPREPARRSLSLSLATIKRWCSWRFHRHCVNIKTAETASFDFSVSVQIGHRWCFSVHVLL